MSNFNFNLFFVLHYTDIVDVIEFNEYPDDETSALSHGGTPVRSVFLTAAWARGITGKFWIISPSRKHPKDFYTGKMRIAPRELFQVLMQIRGGGGRGGGGRGGGGRGAVGGAGGEMGVGGGRSGVRVRGKKGANNTWRVVEDTAEEADGDDSILRADFSLSQFPTEKHGIWEQPNPCFSCIPPPANPAITATAPSTPATSAQPAS
jgi:hypothetical protein